jgi:hypothetical protein
VQRQHTLFSNDDPLLTCAEPTEIELASRFVFGDQVVTGDLTILPQPGGLILRVPGPRSGCSRRRAVTWATSNNNSYLANDGLDAQHRALS